MDEVPYDCPCASSQITCTLLLLVTYLSYFGDLEILLPNQVRVPYFLTQCCAFGFHQTEPMLLMFPNWSCMEMLPVGGWGAAGEGSRTRKL